MARVTLRHLVTQREWGNCDQRWSHPAIITLIIAADPNYAPAPGSAADILCLVLTRHQMWPHQARVPREDPGYSQASQEWAEHYDIKTAQPAHNILNTVMVNSNIHQLCHNNNNIQASLSKWRLVVSCELKQCWANDVKAELIPGVSVWALCHEWAGRAQVIRSRQYTLHRDKGHQAPGYIGVMSAAHDDGPCQQIKRDSPHIWGWKNALSHQLCIPVWSAGNCN